MKHKTNFLPQLFTVLFLPFLSILITITAFSTHAYCAQVTLAWNSVAESNGYKVYYGSATRTYNTPVDVGNNTGHTLDLAPGDYFFAVTAYNGYGESGYSEEVTTAIANPVPVTFSITASAGQNGSISPAGQITVNQGSSQTFTITPATNYHVSNVLVDGLSVGAVISYTFSNIVQSHTISAAFSIDSHTIKAISGLNGSIFPSGDIPVNYGSNQSFTVTPAQNYHVIDLIVDGVSVGALTSYTFTNVTNDHTISAAFAIDTHTIATLAGDQGSISPSGPVTVNHGATQLFVISANENYHIADVIIDGASVGAVTSYIFENITTNHTIGASFEHNNRPPVADAGPDQKVYENATVTVNGANSMDIDENDSIVSYSWVQVGGQTIALANPGAAETTFTAPSAGQEGDALVFQLTVTDSKGLSATDSCIINVCSVNLAPVANAGPDQELKEGDSVTLDGSGSSDPDNDPISYLWEQISGPQAALSSSTSIKPTFTAGDVASDGLSYTFQLTVTDSGGLKATDTCIVNISWVNVPPVANAGSDQTAAMGNAVTLDGSGSTDSDNNISSYKWTQTHGFPVTLSDPSAIKPVFIVPDVGPDVNSFVFQLTVTDSGGLESSDTCTIRVSAMRPPVPDIKANGQDGSITVAKGKSVRITVTLDTGDYAGQKVDWWVTANTPGNVWNSYIWGRRLWVSGIKVSYQAGLTAVSRKVLDSRRLPVGDYTFYFAVDNNMDNKPDATWSDAVTVHIK